MTDSLDAGSRGAVALVNRARPACLRTLVLALDRVATALGTGLHACLRVSELAQVPEGSVVLVCVSQDDTDWIVQHQPLLFERRFRLILWAAEDLATVLGRRAPEVLARIAHVSECPDVVPGFAISNLRQALLYPGTAWRDGNLDAALELGFPDEPVMRVPASSSYADLCQAVTAPGWLVCTGARAPNELMRLRWAMAEHGRHNRVIIEEPGYFALDFWPISGQGMSWELAANMLQPYGIEQAALVAALLDLEPSAMVLAAEQAGALMARDCSLFELLRELEPEADPGAHLARMAAQHELLDLERVAHLNATPAVLRALHRDVRVVVRRATMVADVDRKLRGWIEQAAHRTVLPPWTLDAAELALWGNERPSSPVPPPEALPAHPASAYWLEAVLAGAPALAKTAAKPAPQQPLGWPGAVRWASQLGHHEVAAHWGQLHEVGADVQVLLLFQQGKYCQAEQILSQVIVEARGLRDLAVHTRLLVLLATALKGQGRYDEAETLLQLALEELQQDDSAHISALHLKAEVLAGQGKYAQAEILFCRLLASLELEGGTSDPRYGAALRDLADALQHQGKHGAAEAMCRQALQVNEQTHGLAHPLYMANLEQLASILAGQGKLELAEALYRQILRMVIRLLGAGHPLHGMIQSGLARVLASQGRLEEAEAILLDELVGTEQKLGTVPSSQSAALRSLGMLHASQGQHAQAEEEFRRALAIQERALGAEHLDVATTLFQLAGVLAARNGLGEARDLAQRAQRIVGSHYGSAHPVTAEIGQFLSTLES